jgi:hypothetical protein
MSPDIPCNICPEAKNGHKFLGVRSVALLKSNSEAGCQICSLLYRALEGFHGSWFKECGDSLQFRRFLSINHSLRVDVFLNQAPVGGREIIYAEFVYEELNLR